MPPRDAIWGLRRTIETAARRNSREGPTLRLRKSGAPRAAGIGDVPDWMAVVAHGRGAPVRREAHRIDPHVRQRPRRDSREGTRRDFQSGSFAALVGHENADEEDEEAERKKREDDQPDRVLALGPKILPGAFAIRLQGGTVLEKALWVPAHTCAASGIHVEITKREIPKREIPVDLPHIWPKGIIDALLLKVSLVDILAECCRSCGQSYHEPEGRGSHGAETLN